MRTNTNITTMCMMNTMMCNANDYDAKKNGCI